MKTHFRFLASRSRIWRVSVGLVGLIAAAVAPLGAQAGTQTVNPNHEQNLPSLQAKVDRIMHHDSGSRIAELRIGGITRHIEVQTRSGLPAYQVRPLDPARSPDTDHGSGQRSWRMLQF